MRASYSLPPADDVGMSLGDQLEREGPGGKPLGGLRETALVGVPQRDLPGPRDLRVVAGLGRLALGSERFGVGIEALQLESRALPLGHVVGEGAGDRRERRLQVFAQREGLRIGHVHGDAYLLLGELRQVLGALDLELGGGHRGLRPQHVGPRGVGSGLLVLGVHGVGLGVFERLLGHHQRAASPDVCVECNLAVGGGTRAGGLGVDAGGVAGVGGRGVALVDAQEVVGDGHHDLRLQQVVVEHHREHERLDRDSHHARVRRAGRIRRDQLAAGGAAAAERRVGERREARVARGGRQAGQEAGPGLVDACRGGANALVLRLGAEARLRGAPSHEVGGDGAPAGGPHGRRPPVCGGRGSRAHGARARGRGRRRGRWRRRVRWRTGG